jgi:hypothetical protein
MIEIRPDQMEVFDSRQAEAFLQRALAFLRETHGNSLREMTNEELRERLPRQIATAASYGIRTEAAVMQFIEISLAFGDDFHSSPDCPLAERILSAKTDGAVKVSELLAAAESGFSTR